MTFGSEPIAPPLLRPGRTCWRVACAGRAAFLVDGEVFFAALAAALERARHQVLLLGWDFHGRVRLRRDGRRRSLPDEFQALLRALLERRPALRVHALGWGYGVLRAVARELLPELHLGLGAPRLDFRLDTAHPLLGCHHQKVIVVDDAVAFVGGFDVTDGRWDSRAHRALDGRRVAPDGSAYGPFHDVQMAVDGAAAAALGALARERYRRATGRCLEPPPWEPEHDPWPERLEPSLRAAEVGIARTEPRYGGRKAVREIEALYLDSIAAARRSIYAESQYLTSERAVNALARRLRERDGPEIVVVGPHRCVLLEEISMGVLRARAIERLRAADRHGRLRVYYPRLASGECVHVHSKLMVIDDELVRIGSSNLSNRSLALDSECDLAVEARGRADLSARIASLRDDLLAEHLGISEKEFAAERAARGSLIGAIEALRGGPRTLEPVEPSAPRWAVALVAGSGVADPGDAAEPGAAGARGAFGLRAPAFVLALVAVALAAAGLLPHL